MPTTIQRPASQPRATRRVLPSVVDPATAEPFTLEQELQPFGDRQVSRQPLQLGLQDRLVRRLQVRTAGDIFVEASFGEKLR